MDDLSTPISFIHYNYIYENYIYENYIYEMAMEPANEISLKGKLNFIENH